MSAVRSSETSSTSQTLRFKKEPKIKLHLRDEAWAVSSRCLMIPFICFLGNSLSNLQDSVKACQGAGPHKTPWFLILSADDKIDCRPLCPLHPQQEMSILLSNQDYLGRVISGGNEPLGGQISQGSRHIWLRFPQRSESLSLFYHELYFPKGRDERKCFQVLFGFVALRSKAAFQ